MNRDLTYETINKMFPCITGFSAGDYQYFEWKEAQVNMQNGMIALLSVGKDDKGDTLFKMIDIDKSNTDECKFVQIPDVAEEHELVNPFIEVEDEEVKYTKENPNRDTPKRMKEYKHGDYLCRFCKERYSPEDLKPEILDDITGNECFRCKICGQICILPS